jgi:hypothetical protein
MPVRESVRLDRAGPSRQPWPTAQALADEARSFRDALSGHVLRSGLQAQPVNAHYGEGPSGHKLNSDRGRATAAALPSAQARAARSMRARASASA